MDLPKYTRKALKTAQPEAFRHEYLIPGIVGEIGELFGQRAKAEWHGWPQEKLEDELVSEYGDIAWMTAVLLHTLHVDDVADGKDLPPVIDPDQQLLVQGVILYSDWKTDNGYLSASAANLWDLLRHGAEEITGFPFDFALEANLQKLKSRAKRGVLRGAGDHR